MSERESNLLIKSQQVEGHLRITFYSGIWKVIFVVVSWFLRGCVCHSITQVPNNILWTLCSLGFFQHHCLENRAKVALWSCQDEEDIRIQGALFKALTKCFWKVFSAQWPPLWVTTAFWPMIYLEPFAVPFCYQGYLTGNPPSHHDSTESPVKCCFS